MANPKEDEKLLEKIEVEAPMIIMNADSKILPKNMCSINFLVRESIGMYLTTTEDQTIVLCPDGVLVSSQLSLKNMQYLEDLKVVNLRSDEHISFQVSNPGKVFQSFHLTSVGLCNVTEESIVSFQHFVEKSVFPSLSVSGRLPPLPSSFARLMILSLGSNNINNIEAIGFLDLKN